MRSLPSVCPSQGLWIIQITPRAMKQRSLNYSNPGRNGHQDIVLHPSPENGMRWTTLCPCPRCHRHFHEDDFYCGDNQHHTDENEKQIAGLPVSQMIITSSLGVDDHVATTQDR